MPIFPESQEEIKEQFKPTATALRSS